MATQLGGASLDSGASTTVLEDVHKHRKRAERKFEKPGATWRSGGLLRNMMMDDGAQVLEDVRKLGRLPKEYNNPKTEDEVAEKNFAVNSAVAISRNEPR